MPKQTPTYLQMAIQAVAMIPTYKAGASRQAISKYITKQFDKEKVNTVALRTALKKAVAEGFMTRDGFRYFLAQEKRDELRKERELKKRKAIQKAKPKKAKKKKSSKKKSSKKKSSKKSSKKKSSKKKSSKKKSSKKSSKKKSSKKSATKKSTKKSTKSTKKASTKKASTKKASIKKTTAKPKRKAEAVQETKKKSKLEAEPTESSDVVSSGDDVLEAQLVQVNVEANVDKFYHLKVVPSGSSFTVVANWGRTGTVGQTTYETFPDLPSAKEAFEKKFKEKTGANFADRQSYTAAAGKYSFKNVNYEKVKETGLVKWQYYVNDHVDGKATGWYDYFDEASAIVEGVFQEWQDNRSWLDVRSVQSGHWTYKVDFNAKTQQNIKTNKIRFIRRSIDGSYAWGAEK